MFPPQNPQQGGLPQAKNNNYYESIQGLAIVLAIATTLIVAPYLNNLTADFIKSIFIENYGSDLAEFLCWVWEALVFGFTFFLARAYVTAAVITMGLWIAARIPAVII